MIVAPQFFQPRAPHDDLLLAADDVAAGRFLHHLMSGWQARDEAKCVRIPAFWRNKQ